MSESKNSVNLQLENVFWLQILSDHSRFFISSLSPEETELISIAAELKDVADNLLNAARSNRDVSELALQFALEFRIYKQELLTRTLLGNIKIGLGSTFISHTLNEINEYIDILRGVNSTHPLHLENLWIDDAAGHADYINDQLDSTEKKRKKEMHKFCKSFEHIHSTVVEFLGYIKNGGPAEFPKLEDLKVESVEKLKLFGELLNEFRTLKLNKQILGPLLPLAIDHMLRETAYSLYKLTGKIFGDFTQPRIES